MNKTYKILLFTMLQCFVLNAVADPFNTNEQQIIKQHLLQNIATEQHTFIKNNHDEMIHSIPGMILASPSNKEPHFSQDYQFHWTRDAALTMNEVIFLYRHASFAEKKLLKSYLINYIHFEYKAQHPGEPKYNLDGTPWQGPWARPQNDGPALQAITLMAIAHLFMQENQTQDLPPLFAMITNDLDYIAQQWKNTSYDLWEEVNTRYHFFTNIVQRKALLEGAIFVNKMGDARRAQFYKQTANEITLSLLAHWDNQKKSFLETSNQKYRKAGGIDTSLLFGLLYGNLQNVNDVFALNNDRVLNTVATIRNAFTHAYPINTQDHVLLLGRYPDDIYDGDQFKGGNPWILSTAALAQYYYALANLYLSQGKITINQNNAAFFQQLNIAYNKQTIDQAKQPQAFKMIIQSLIDAGDQALQAVKRYSVCYPDKTCYHLSEQIDRINGAPVSARDLTWNYAIVLSALRERAKLANHAASPL